MTSPAPRPDRADRLPWRLRRWMLRLVTLAVLVVAIGAAWNSRWAQAPRLMWALSRMAPPTALPVPVQGITPNQIADTFGAPRGRDRQHAGIDIFARRGTPVLSATVGIVTNVSERGLGGRQVWVLGPARERYYYAHLHDWQPGLAVGDIVQAGSPLGTVGDTGNAKGTPPHLHWGIYGAEGAYDPLPLLRAQSP